jgi:hypothetical protein
VAAIYNGHLKSFDEGEIGELRDRVAPIPREDKGPNLTRDGPTKTGRPGCGIVPIRALIALRFENDTGKSTKARS